MRHEQEVDTQLAQLWAEEGAARAKVAGDLLSLQHAVGDKRPGGFRAYRDPDQFTTTPEQAEARAREAHAAGTVPLRVRSAVEYALLDLRIQRAVIDMARRDAEPLEAEYRANPWSRFFLVVNHGGHVHRTRSCPTTFPTTQWAWLPQLSGLDEAAAVADQGPRLCSVCFPSAPVEWTLGLPATPKCPGSGAIVERHGRSRYGTCPTCGQSYALSNAGAIRAHKPKGA